MSSETSNDIWEKVYHTDARVTAMEGQLSDVNNAVSRIEQHLLNKPQANVLGWMGALLTLVGGSLFFMIEYVSLTQEPLLDTQAAREEVIQEYMQFKHQTHYEFGVLHEWKRDTRSELDHQHERLHALQSEISDLQKSTATHEAHLEALKNDIVDIDAHGSRKWIEERNGS